jgi:predicted nuclease of predicted toxin-antitoxin system
VRFLADMGVSYTVVHHLRTSGHDALHLRDIGMQRMPDDEVFAMATQDKRVILTFDLDFARLAANAGSQLPSVVIFRLNDTRVHQLIERLTIALTLASPALLAGAVVVVDDARVRVRDLPIR